MITSLIQHIVRILGVSIILFKEQFREPITILWTLVAPCMLYVISRGSAGTLALSEGEYALSSSWFFTYLSASTAFFGLGFYLIGRRESGFVRSFIYKAKSIRIFVAAHVSTHVVVSLVYASFFYLATRTLYGVPAIAEYAKIMLAYLFSYMAFASLGLIISLLPMKFSSASTVFSVLSFLMLTSGYMGGVYKESSFGGVIQYSPLALMSALFSQPLHFRVVGLILGCFGVSLYCVIRYFRVHPVWGRY